MNRLFQIAAIVAATFGILGMPAAARADFQLTLTDGTNTATYSSTAANPNFVASPLAGVQIGQLAVSSMAFSNSPGGANAIVGASTFTLYNQSASAQTFTISVLATGFNSPQSPPPLSLLDTVSGSIGNGTVTGTFQGFADTSANATAGSGTAGQLLNFSASGSSQSFSVSGSADNVFSPDGSTYSLSLVETVTLSGGAIFTVTTGNVSAVMPAPSSVLLLLSSLPVLGSVWASRRRKIAAPAQPTAVA